MSTPSEIRTILEGVVGSTAYGLAKAEHALGAGEVLVHVDDRHDEAFAAGELAEGDPAEFARMVEDKMEQVKATPSVLWDEPDVELADLLLYRVRMNELD